MSSEALAWAFKCPIKQSSVKLTLIALCECANYKTGRIFPSIEHLVEITSQNRKTIIGNISALEAMGAIRDTGERVGATKQIKVYEALLGTVPKVEQSRKRNSSKNGRKQSQKRDTEPSREPSSLKTKRALADNWMPDEFGPRTKSGRIVDGWTQDESETHLEAFAAHHRKLGNKFECWQSAWSTWVLNTVKFKAKDAANGTRNNRGGSTWEIGQELLREIGQG